MRTNCRMLRKIISRFEPAPKAPIATLARELADIFFSAVWRNPEGSGEREAIWQAVENAAVGLCAISEALSFPPPQLILANRANSGRAARPREHRDAR